MNSTDQIKVVLSMFAVQLPTLIVCFAAGLVLVGKWKQASRGAVWALLGFGIATVLCFAIPIGQVIVQAWFRRSGGSMVERASVFAGISVVWSVLRAISYAFLLVAVFAGRASNPPTS